MLDFHHMDRKQKLFCVNKRSIGMYGWIKIVEEMLKCMLVCCRCHREIEHKYIPKETAEQIYLTKWEEINNRNPEWHKFSPKVHAKDKDKNCQQCGKFFKSISSTQKCCSRECSNIRTRKVGRPSVGVLLDLLKKHSWSAVGRMFNVTDNTVRKWIKFGRLEQLASSRSS